VARKVEYERRAAAFAVGNVGAPVEHEHLRDLVHNDRGHGCFGMIFEQCPAQLELRVLTEAPTEKIYGRHCSEADARRHQAEQYSGDEWGHARERDPWSHGEGERQEKEVCSADGA
jgi:hypothetical protein